MDLLVLLLHTHLKGWTTTTRLNSSLLSHIERKSFCQRLVTGRESSLDDRDNLTERVLVELRDPSMRGKITEWERLMLTYAK